MKTTNNKRDNHSEGEKDVQNRSDKSDIMVVNDQDDRPKDSENKDKNAANAKANPGHYHSEKPNLSK